MEPEPFNGQLSLDDYVGKTTHMFYVDYLWTDECLYGAPEPDYLETLKKYFTAGIVGYEITKEGVKHLQCYCIATPNKYNSFIGQWKRDYKARTGREPTGRAKKGERRNYGRVKGLKKDPKYAMAYCMKDGVYYTWNLDEDLVKEASKITYKPEKERDKFEKMMDFMKDNQVIWKHNDKLDFISIVVKEHLKIYGTPLQKRMLDKYLLSSGVVSYLDYTRANFSYYRQAYHEDEF